MEKGAVRIWTSPLFVIGILFMGDALDFKEPRWVTEESQVEGYSPFRSSPSRTLAIYSRVETSTGK